MRALPGRNHFRYLPPDPEDAIWGVRVIDAGSGRIAPGETYPPPGHPEGYAFDWDQGRVIGEFQIVCILAGRGSFESRSGRTHELRAGLGFVLFPGEWHRYRPDPETGWSELWAGFDGDYARHLAGHFLSPDRPVFEFGGQGELVTLLRRVGRLAGKAGSAERVQAALDVLRAIACLRQLREARTPDRNPAGPRIERARMEILARAAEDIDWAELATRLGMSYSDFRRQFRRATGGGPHQYQLLIRLNRAKALLANGEHPIGDIAARIGFESAYYFSHLFKRRTGSSPLHWRQLARAKAAPAG